MTPPAIIGQPVKETLAVFAKALTAAGPVRAVSRGAWRPHRLGVDKGNEVLRDF